MATSISEGRRGESGLGEQAGSGVIALLVTRRIRDQRIRSVRRIRCAPCDTARPADGLTLVLTDDLVCVGRSATLRGVESRAPATLNVQGAYHHGIIGQN